jgi:shikimate kinase
VIDELTQTQQGVIATGGGAVLREANRRHMHERGQVIYLRSTPEDVFRRVRHDTARPLLQVDDPLSRLRTLFASRDPLYREAAHFVIETGRPSVAMLVNMICMQLELAGHLPLKDQAGPQR